MKIISCPVILLLRTFTFFLPELKLLFTLLSPFKYLYHTRCFSIVILQIGIFYVTRNTIHYMINHHKNQLRDGHRSEEQPYSFPGSIPTGRMVRPAFICWAIFLYEEFIRILFCPLLSMLLFFNHSSKVYR